jgi:hypothetical protein
MTIQEIQRLREAMPFQPFRVLLADGRASDVDYSELIAQTGSGRLISIGQRDSFITLDLLLVTGIERPIPNETDRAADAKVSTIFV